MVPDSSNTKQLVPRLAENRSQVLLVVAVLIAAIVTLGTVRRACTIPGADGTTASLRAAASSYQAAAGSQQHKQQQRRPPAPLLGCPMPWLSEYEAFHKATRGAPGAKYLVHSVDGIYSGGFGDRLRGMLYALRAAAAMKRVVLFRWSYPHAVTHFFAPAGDIDWRTDGVDLSGGGLSVRSINMPVQQLEDGSLLNSDAKVITLQVCIWGGRGLGGGIWPAD